MAGAAARAASLGLALILSGESLDAQGRTPPTPRPPGNGSPFRLKNFAGSSIEAGTLEQPGCPIWVGIETLTRSDRGVMLSLRLSNLGDGPSTRQVVGAWVIVPDGTVRGYQRLNAEKEIADGGSRGVDLVIRTTTVLPDDLIVVAVQEVVGADPWRQDTKAIEKEVRASVVR